MQTFGHRDAPESIVRSEQGGRLLIHVCPPPGVVCLAQDEQTIVIGLHRYLNAVVPVPVDGRTPDGLLHWRDKRRVERVFDDGHLPGIKRQLPHPFLGFFTRMSDTGSEDHICAWENTRTLPESEPAACSVCGGVVTDVQEVERLFLSGGRDNESLQIERSVSLHSKDVVHHALVPVHDHSL